MRKSSGKFKPENSTHSKISTIWEIVLFSAIATFLGIFLFKNGWRSINEKSINIKGSVNTTREQIINSMNIELPIAILKINTKQIENNLLSKLPIKAVAIKRSFNHPRLNIQILERTPIAIAFRQNKNGEEKGFIDLEGNWLSFIKPIQSSKKTNDLIINGWEENKRYLIRKIIANQTKLDLALKRIIFDPNGEIRLQTAEFLEVHLGNNPSILNLQLAVLSHLTKALPEDLMNESNSILDLKKPSKPKISESSKEK